MRSALVPLLPLLCLLGCPSKTTVEPPPDTKSPSEPSEPSEPASDGEEQASAEPSSEAEVEILSARSTGESIPAATVTLRFRNATASAVVIEAYRIDWPGGSFEAEPTDLRIDAGGEVERTTRIEPRHGDVGVLLRRTEEATVKVTRRSP